MFEPLISAVSEGVQWNEESGDSGAPLHYTAVPGPELEVMYFCVIIWGWLIPTDLSLNTIF